MAGPAWQWRNVGSAIDVCAIEVQKITIYTAAWCGYCRAAKRLLDEHGLGYEEVGVGDDPHFRERLQKLTGSFTVPQILISGEPVGGYMELVLLAQRGELDELVAPTRSA